MKNIHVLPTDKPSRLHYFTANKAGYYLYPNNELVVPRNPNCINQNIYITSDEKFIRDEYITEGIEVIKASPKLVDAQGLIGRRDWRKIILTTDQELIKDGVQAIDDEFLEWFVKNPSCEEVDIKIDIIVTQTKPLLQHQGSKPIVVPHKINYEIAIPKEEPCDNCNNEVCCCIIRKQETLEEITEQIQKDCHKFVESIISKVTYQDATNTFLFMKLAELTLKLKKYE